MSVIYLSGPIANGHTASPREMYKNVRNGEDLMYKLMKKGWSVICPHLSYHAWINWPDDIPWERWLQQDYDFVSKADAFFYMDPKIYGKSKGAEREHEWAKAWNKPIYYTIDDVPSIKHPITKAKIESGDIMEQPMEKLSLLDVS